MTNSIADKSYLEFLNDLKQRVLAARYKAALSVNRELVLLYHHIGTKILESQKQHGWGAKVVEQLSRDLRTAFPEMKGFSRTNLLYMRKFAEEYPDPEFVQQAAAQLPWFHLVVIMDKVQGMKIREFYIQKAVENGWSRNVLVHQIESNLYERQGTNRQVTNFSNTLPAMQSDLATNIVKDTYILHFLDSQHNERELERSLVRHIQKFLLELGKGFAFMGNQYQLNVGGQEFFIDMLFYHCKLRCYVAIELEAGAFKPEYAGKMHFYLNALDKEVKHKDDNPSIGLILCKEKNRIVAEYTIDGMRSPMGVANYKFGNELLEDLQRALPTEEELNAELRKVGVEVVEEE